MMLRILSSLLVLISSSGLLSAQDSISNDLRFAEWLYTKGKYSLCLTQTKTLLQDNSDGRLNLLINKCYFKIGKYEMIEKYNLKSDSSVTDLNSLLYFGAHCYIDSELPAVPVLLKYSDDYLYLYKKVFYLKNKQFSNYKSLEKPVLVSNSMHVEKLNYLFRDYEKTISKKPWKAAGLSMVIPGLGKVYAGRPNEMIGPLVKSIIVGLVTYEGYRKNEFRSPQFYFFGSLFLFTYTSSVYGSYKAIHTNRKDAEVKYYDQLSDIYKDISNHILQ